MFAPEHIALHAELLKEAEEKVAVDPGLAKTLLTAGAGATAAGIPMYMLMHHQAEAAREKTRNQAFGAGVASGLAGPRILRGVLNIAQNSGFIDPPGGVQ